MQLAACVHKVSKRPLYTYDSENRLYGRLEKAVQQASRRIGVVVIAVVIIEGTPVCFRLRRKVNHGGSGRYTVGERRIAVEQCLGSCHIRFFE